MTHNRNKHLSLHMLPVVFNEALPHMNQIKLCVKNMVTSRCKWLVASILEKENLPYLNVRLGEIEMADLPSPDQLNILQQGLASYGFLLMNDHKSILVEKIKAVVIDMVHQANPFPNVKHSAYISKKLNHNYTYLANLFSEVKGVTLERYIILHKIEKVKELIFYGELNLSQIACRLNYSSVGHLSNQFKQITGLSPSQFKKSGTARQIPLEDL